MKDDVSYFFFLTVVKIPLFDESTGNIGIEKQTVWTDVEVHTTRKQSWLVPLAGSLIIIAINRPFARLGQVTILKQKSMGYSSKNALHGKSARKSARRPILRRLTHKTKVL